METIEPVPVAEIFPLRWSVLRPGLPPETARYPEDSDPAVFHLAARDGTGAVICCATFFPDPLPAALAARPADPAVGGGADWRFRGMATDPRRRGRGVGGRLLEGGLVEVARRGGRRVWCNGRVAASAFYQRHGFTPRGDEFTLAPAGPHYVFVRDLTTRPAGQQKELSG